MADVNLIAQKLIACEECDELYRQISLKPGFAAFCRRCGAELFWPRTFHIDTLLALTLGSLVMFLIANTLPIVTLVAKGVHHGTTLLGAIVAFMRVVQAADRRRVKRNAAAHQGGQRRCFHFDAVLVQ